MAVPAASTFQPIGPRNVFIPSYDGDARARLLVEYVLNPKAFALNRYVTIQPLNLPVGFYAKVLASDYVRVPYSAGQDAQWADGQPSGALTNRDQGPRITNIQYELYRTKRERNVGWLTQQFSPFDTLKETQNMLAGIAMTYRALNVMTVATTSANYDSTHVKTATQWGGGFLNSGTPSNPIIKTALDNIRDRIVQDSINSVKLKDLRWVMSPTAASALSRSQEIRVYLMQQANSIKVLTGEDPDSDDNWSMPAKYNGFEIIVDPAVYTNTLVTDNSTTATDGDLQYVWPNNTSWIGARPGALVSESGGMNFSTVHLLEMKGQAFKVFMEDMGEREKYTYTRVEDFFQPIVAAPETGALITNMFQ